jgi:hypothetical protein
MDSSGVSTFAKQAACPSSKTLLAYRATALAPQMMQLVKWHLADCDFCWAEMRLLAFYAAPRKGECRSPAMPVNLRILAEALLHASRPPLRGPKISEPSSAPTSQAVH